MKRLISESVSVKRTKYDTEINEPSEYINAIELVRRMTWLSQYFPNSCLVFDCIAWFCDENNQLINQHMFASLRNELEKSDFYYDIMSPMDDYDTYTTENPITYYYVLVNSNKSDLGLFELSNEIFKYLYDGVKLTYGHKILFPFKDNIPTNLSLNERREILENVFPNHGPIELILITKKNTNFRIHCNQHEDIIFKICHQDIVHVTIHCKCY